MSARGVNRLIALGIFFAVLIPTVAFSTTQGVHRDEAYYMDAGEQYIGYWGQTISGELAHPFSDAAIKRFWEYNHEHPPLMKLAYGLSWRLFHKCDCAAEAKWHAGASVLRDGRHVTLPIFSEITAFRLPTMICFALLCAFVFLWGAEVTGKRAGAIAAALLMAAQPRAFFHAETASFDLPAAMFWLVTTYAYWRSLSWEHPVRRGILVGVLYGLFLATKLQSFFLPIALILHYGAVTLTGLLLGKRDERAEIPNPIGLGALFVIGPIVFVALWPWLWHHPLDRFAAYLAFHWKHVHYNFEYMGVNYNRPPYPRTEPIGLLVTTAPVVLLALAVAGGTLLARRGVRALRGVAPRDPRATSLLWFGAGLLPVAPFFLGSTPIFGETKHWLSSMPFLALAAGVAVQALVDRLAEELPRLPRAALAAAVVLVSFVPAAVETVRSHPYGLSHYNALAGGAPGGADLGMNRQFWGYSVRGLLPWMNATLPRGSRVYLHDWNHDAYEMYLRDGLLRPDIQDAGMELPGVRASDTALVIHEKHFNKYEYMIWDVYKTVQPAKVLTYDGVPLVTVYRRERP